MPWPTSPTNSLWHPPRKRPIKRRFNGREARTTPMSVAARAAKPKNGSAKNGRGDRST